MYKGTIENGYDVGILILKKDFQLNKNVQLAQLPTLGTVCPLEAMLIASGWGLERQGPNEQIRPIKHQYMWAVTQECFDVDACTGYTGEKRAIICAGGPKDARDTSCSGDSGGNLVNANVQYIYIYIYIQ